MVRAGLPPLARLRRDARGGNRTNGARRFDARGRSQNRQLVRYWMYSKAQGAPSAWWGVGSTSWTSGLPTDAYRFQRFDVILSEAKDPRLPSVRTDVDADSSASPQNDHQPLKRVNPWLTVHYAECLA